MTRPSAAHAATAVVALGFALGAWSSACDPAALDLGAVADAHVAVHVAPLSLPGLERACFRLTALAVPADGPEIVWQRAGVCSDAYGDGGTGLSFVGPCDARTPSHRVRLELEGLWDADGVIPTARYRSPCGHLDDGDGAAPCERPVTCMANADAAVTFDLTILRAADQGFFDFAVTFDDIFCSAKVDCVESFLHHPATGQRAPTTIVAFACTSGEGSPTWLHLSDLAVACEEGHTWLAPHLGPGQAGPQSEAVWQLATYRGQEGFGAVDKCYWNVAFGLDLGLEGAARGCRLLARGTATAAPLGPGGATPMEAVYPYITFDVPLTDPDGAVVCGAHPLNEPGSGVATAYTHDGPVTFPWSWACGADTDVPTDRLLCAGQSGVDQGAFVTTDAGLVFQHGDASSPPYELPEGLTLEGCCGNPCPGCQ